MKSNIRAGVFAVALMTGSLANPVTAAGIPTIDVASIAQLILDAMEQAQMAAEQLNQLEAEYEQTKDQFEENKGLITGNSGYGARHNNAELYDYLPTDTTTGSWEQIYENMPNSTLNQYRDRYGLRSEEVTQQEVYDKKLTNLYTLETAFRANNLRLENIHALMAEADTATTPQQKDDIQARIAAEQAAIANEAARLSSIQDLMDRQDEMLVKRQNQEFREFLRTGGE